MAELYTDAVYAKVSFKKNGLLKNESIMCINNTEVFIWDPLFTSFQINPALLLSGSLGSGSGGGIYSQGLTIDENGNLTQTIGLGRTENSIVFGSESYFESGKVSYLTSGGVLSQGYAPNSGAAMPVYTTSSGSSSIILKDTTPPTWAVYTGDIGSIADGTVVSSSTISTAFDASVPYPTDLTYTPGSTTGVVKTNTINIGLRHLGDVDMSGATDNQILKYDATVGKFVSSTACNLIPEGTHCGSLHHPRL